MNRPIYLDAQTVRMQIERLRLLFPEMDDDAQLLADVLEGQTELNEVMCRLVRTSRDAQAYAAAIKDEVTDLRERQERYERRSDAARSVMMALMEASGLPRLEIPIATISVVQGKQTCTITDQDALSLEYLKVETTPRKTEITKALQSGIPVPGAVLSNGAPSLRVRV